MQPNNIVEKLREAQPIFFENPFYDPSRIQSNTDPYVEEARERLARFSSYFTKYFPETRVNEGLIECPLTLIPHFQQALQNVLPFGGKLFIKQDNALPISGSIKARGGIYEVLKVAEEIALQEGMLSAGNNYEIFGSDAMRTLFSNYTISVGSTGNLGLSIGLMGRALGFQVVVHMSSDARQWKKDRLRAHGATVIEYEEDYGAAVAKGREEAEKNPKNHFVDDENSKDLFYGYAVAGERLALQLKEQNIIVDEDHPLFVYLPCGVGGGPGGICYGIQNALGPHAHCLFAEPVQAPCMLLSIGTQTHGAMDVRDIGLTGHTEADGLAVNRASALVSKEMTHRLDGLYTVEDEKLNVYTKLLYDTENIYIEPSAAATIEGPSQVNGLYTDDQLKNATHLLWSTGGSMVPEEEKEKILK